MKNFGEAIRQRLVGFTTNADRRAIKPTHCFRRAASAGNRESSPQNERLGTRRRLGVLRRHNVLAQRGLAKRPCRFSYRCGDLTMFTLREAAAAACPPCRSVRRASRSSWPNWPANAVWSAGSGAAPGPNWRRGWPPWGAGFDLPAGLLRPQGNAQAVRGRMTIRKEKAMMLPIDHHVQHALYKFNRDMKRLNHGTTVPPLAGQRRKGGCDHERPGLVSRLRRAVVNCLGQRRSAPDKPGRSDWAPAQLPSVEPAMPQ